MAMNIRRAMSLIEVVLAIVILGLAVPPLMIQLGAAVRSQTTSVLQLNMVQLASERLNEVLADYADQSRGYAYIITGNYPGEADPAGFKGYKRVTTVREVDPADYVSAQPGSGIKRLRIDVTGPDGNTLQLESFVVELAQKSKGKSKDVKPAPRLRPGPPKKAKPLP